MRHISALALTLSVLPLTAQTTHSTRATAASHPARAEGGCVRLPALSPRIPPLPAGSPCAKALYTLTTIPSVRVDYTSPMENATRLRDTLGIAPETFSLAYVDTRVGMGPPAEPHKWYKIHYTGYLADGTKFDSSYDHPNHEPIVVHYGEHQVIPGWDTGLDGMHVGGRRRLFIPWQLAYGPNGRPPTIPTKAELIFDVELVAQSDTDPRPKPTVPATEPGRAPAGRPGIEVRPVGPPGQQPKIQVVPMNPPTPATPATPARPTTPAPPEQE